MTIHRSDIQQDLVHFLDEVENIENVAQKRDALSTKVDETLTQFIPEEIHDILNVYFKLITECQYDLISETIPGHKAYLKLKEIATEEIQRLDQQVAHLQAKLDERNKQAQQNEILTAENQHLRQEVVLLRTEFADITEQVQQLHDQNSALIKKVDLLCDELEEYKEKEEQLRAEKEELTERVEELQHEPSRRVIENRMKNPQRYRDYQREYMREYRKRNKREAEDSSEQDKNEDES